MAKGLPAPPTADEAFPAAPGRKGVLDALLRDDRLYFALLLLVCGIPLLVSLPTIGDPFGQTEEAVNASIWSLGARNIVEKGPVASLFGASIAPHRGLVLVHGKLAGTYTHHPPLAIWLLVPLQLAGGWEGLPRLLGLLLAAASLWGLGRLVEPFAGRATALVAAFAAATSLWVAADGRLMTTLTVATPFFVYLLRRTALAIRGVPPDRWVFLATALLVLSSWDGVLCAAVFVPVLAFVELRGRTKWDPGPEPWRAFLPLAGAAAGLALVAAWMLQGGASPGELLGQFLYRSGVGAVEYTRGAWLARQVSFVRDGLGPVSLLALCLSPLALRRRRKDGLGLVLLLSLVPGIGMILLFRQGAFHHRFWGFNLFVPAALAVAVWLRRASDSRRPVAAAILAAAVAVQGYAGLQAARQQLDEESVRNGNGALARDWYRAHPVAVLKVFSAYDFHPYLNWYLKVPTEVILSAELLSSRLAAGSDTPAEPLFVDTVYTSNLGCRSFPSLAKSSSGRWVVALAADVESACRRPSEGKP